VWDVAKETAKEALLTSASLIDGVATRASFGDVAQQVAQQEKLCDEVNVQIKSADADLVQLGRRRLATYQARESMLAEMLVSVTEVTADRERLLQFKQVRATLDVALLDNGSVAQPAATEIAVDESACSFKKAHVRLHRAMVEVHASACDMLQVLAVEEEKCANCVVHRSALEERLDLVRAVIASHAQANVLRASFCKRHREMNNLLDEQDAVEEKLAAANRVLRRAAAKRVHPSREQVTLFDELTLSGAATQRAIHRVADKLQVVELQLLDMEDQFPEVALDAFYEGWCAVCGSLSCCCLCACGKLH
jgi:hypothetical protein